MSATRVGGTTDSGRQARRVAYREAGAAMREMNARLRAVRDELRPVDRDVALAVLCLTASWSRTSDRVTRRQVAEEAGCHEQTAGKSLTRLDRLGVISWTPTRRHGGMGLLSIEPRHETAVVSSHETAVVSSIDREGVPEEKTLADALDRSSPESFDREWDDVETAVGGLRSDWEVGTTQSMLEREPPEPVAKVVNTILKRRRAGGLRAVG